MTAERSLVLRLLLLVGVFGAVVPREIHATTLTGVALYACDNSGEPTGEFWHTSLDPSGHPIGFTRWAPSAARGIFPFGNDPGIRHDGDISIELLPISHVITLFWQYTPGQFPDHVALNLFFNGDNLNPGISAVVPWLAGFTLFATNPRATTLSLYSREVQNPGSLVYDDGTVSARLGTAYYFRSAVNLDIWMWRPSDLINVDRVGLTHLAPDGIPDAVMVFELVVTPSQQANSGTARPTPAQPVGLVPPLSARVGEDLWTPPGQMNMAPPESGSQTDETIQGSREPTPGPSLAVVAETSQTPAPEATATSAAQTHTPARARTASTAVVTVPTGTDVTPVHSATAGSTPARAKLTPGWP
jgi:hypothetical protein